jgi:hypothetical protein
MLPRDKDPGNHGGHIVAVVADPRREIGDGHPLCEENRPEFSCACDSFLRFQAFPFSNKLLSF